MKKNIRESCSSALVWRYLPCSIFYLRPRDCRNPQTYLYLEIGGTLISFCYAANALVRFRGTHDRTALILSFGFVSPESLRRSAISG